MTPRHARTLVAPLAALVLAAAGCAKHDDSGTTQATSSPTASPAAPPTSSVQFLGTHYPSQGHAHFEEGASTAFAYNSNPPTSGPHKEMFSDTFNSATPLPKYVQVHLLEHGNVLLQYNCDCPQLAGALYQIAYGYDSKLIPSDQLQPTTAQVQAAEESGAAVIVAPYPGMTHKIALTAWTRLATLDAVDQAKIMSFINAYVHNTANASQ
ncbi:MAG: DUF3105 domain-containing protein [Candidatus Eremiobacteraeota bacterium]|nr:DUF3105 domain-containing protein [Candidatus Eremiobacteraeota bacterium]MBV8366332.1 DUF3105 domain-containing protein [Candidatus Eremiobacteraeota bacterium]